MIRVSQRPVAPPAVDGVIADIRAVRRARVVVSMVMTVRAPGAEPYALVKNLRSFTDKDRYRCLRFLAVTLAHRYPGADKRPRILIGDAGVSFRAALASLEEVDVEAAHGTLRRQGPALRDPAGMLAHPRCQRLERDRLVVATDGSFNPVTGVSASAVVSDTGLANAGPGRTRDAIVGAEIQAIVLALRTFPLHDLLVLSDSRRACSAVSAALDGTIQDRSSTISADLARCAELGHGRSIELRWVQGHNGHALNEAADRVARAQRRETEGISAPLSTRTVMNNVRFELLTCGSPPKTAGQCSELQAD